MMFCQCYLANILAANHFLTENSLVVLNNEHKKNPNIFSLDWHLIFHVTEKDANVIE